MKSIKAGNMVIKQYTWIDLFYSLFQPNFEGLSFKKYLKKRIKKNFKKSIIFDFICLFKSLP